MIGLLYINLLNYNIEWTYNRTKKGTCCRGYFCCWGYNYYNSASSEACLDNHRYI